MIRETKKRLSWGKLYLETVNALRLAKVSQGFPRQTQDLFLPPMVYPTGGDQGLLGGFHRRD